MRDPAPPSRLQARAARDRRYRKRQAAGVMTVAVEIDAMTLDFMIATQWLAESEAGDQACDRRGAPRDGARRDAEVSIAAAAAAGRNSVTLFVTSFRHNFVTLFRDSSRGANPVGRPPIGATAMSAAERQRRRRLRQKTGDAPLRSVAEERAALDAELRQAGADVVRLEAEVAALRGALARERKQREAAEAKISKPAAPPTPTEEAQRLMAQVERLKASNGELVAKNRHLTKYYDDEITKKGGMPRATFNKVVMCLHSDREPSAAEREARSGAPQWKETRDKEARR